MKKIIILLLLVLAVSSTNINAQISRNIKFSKNYNPRPSQPLSQFGSIYAACWGWTAPNGREYAILCCVTGTSFVDITDTNNIVEKDFVPGSTTPWREVKVYQNYAYVVTDNAGGGMQIINMSFLPDSVSLVKTWNYTGFTQGHSISNSGRFMYINGGNAASNGGIAIVDLLDPVNPVRRGRYTSKYVHDSFIRNDTIYAAIMFNNQYGILDARNKDTIRVIKEFNNLPSYSLTHNCEITADRKYLITTDEGQSPPGSVKIWNIQNYDMITYVGSLRPSTPATNNAIGHNIFIKGNLLVVSHYEAGIRFFDLRGLPNSVQEVAFYDTYPGADSAAYRGNWGAYPYFASGKIISSDMQTGLWIHMIDTTTANITSNNNALVKSYLLGQNYPNPFNPETVIEFSVPDNIRGEFVSLKVYNALGKEVATLINKQLSAGNYTAKWDAAGFPGGVYFYKLSAENFTETRKMMLVK